MIDIKGLSKSYNKGSVKAVDDLNLEVRSGEIFGFLGPNGAGKTTTIKMIVGLLNPDAGQIMLDGKDIQKQPIEAKMTIGYVPDNPDMFERLTGLEYLNFMADVYMVPMAMSLPLWIMPMRSHSFSATSSTWVEKKTVLPSSQCFRMSSLS
jgi:ABC-2 type transport system ATP-binding protein